MRPSQAAERDHEHVLIFISSFERLIEAGRNLDDLDRWDPSEEWLPDENTVSPERGAAIRGEYEAACAAVAVASGPASEVAERLGRFAVVASRQINPIAAWDSFYPGDVIAGPSEVLAFSRALAGSCETRVAHARSLEKGLAGAVARFVRFPNDVRDAAGLQTKAGQRAAFWSGVAVQVLGGLLVVAVVYLIPRVF